MLLFLISRSGNRACVGAEQSSRPKLPRLGVSWEEHKIPLPPLLSSHTQEHTHTHILTHTQRPPPVSVPMYLRCQMAEDKSSWGKTAWWPLPSLTRTFSQIEDTWKYRAVVVSWGSVVGGGVVGNTHQWTPSHTERRWAPKSRVWCTTHRVGFKKKNNPQNVVVFTPWSILDLSCLHSVCRPDRATWWYYLTSACMVLADPPSDPCRHAVLMKGVQELSWGDRGGGGGGHGWAAQRQPRGERWDKNFRNEWGWHEKSWSWLYFLLVSILIKALSTYSGGPRQH